MNLLRSRGLKVAVASSSAAPDIMKMLTEGGLKAMVDFAFSGETAPPISLHQTSISRR